MECVCNSEDMNNDHTWFDGVFCDSDGKNNKHTPSMKWIDISDTVVRPIFCADLRCSLRKIHQIIFSSTQKIRRATVIGITLILCSVE